MQVSGLVGIYEPSVGLLVYERKEVLGTEKRTESQKIKTLD